MEHILSKFSKEIFNHENSKLNPYFLQPMMIVSAVESSVALKRLNKFLNAEEIDEDAVQEDPTESKFPT
jgi:hypothetical protein